MTALLEAAPATTPEAEDPPARAPAAWSGASTVLVGLIGVVFGATAIFHPFGAVHIGWLLPLVGVTLHLDPLGGFFVALTGAVAVAVGSYAIGYARRAGLARTPLLVLPLFVAAMLIVPAAGSVTTFLLAWELMAAASLVLVVAEHRHAAARAAGLSYAVMTQLGFAAILLGLIVLSASGGADAFAALATTEVPPGTRAVVFVLTVVGFGSKAGLLPLHAWLPRAHPEAPSPVSALMSAAMVNLGIYGIIRVDLQLLGPGPRWWGLTLLIVGAASAVFGALSACVATDLKRLLAYSTTENMGLTCVALGAAILLAATDQQPIAAVAMIAALLHLVGHAAFKTLGFLAAGSVLIGTGERDLDRLGGLARPMPATTALFGVAALGASGLPLGAGFVSEWLMVQCLIHSPNQGHTLLALTMPLAVGAIALTTGLGVAAMVKAFGVGFLARPRSAGAAGAREAPASMLTAMALAGVACIAVALAPTLLSAPLGRVLPLLPATGDISPRLRTVLHLPGTTGSIAPGLLAVALVAAVLAAIALARWGSRRRPAPATAPLWMCGGERLSPRMQYTATSFAEPLQRVFDDVLRPDTDVEVTHIGESRYLVEKVAYRARLADAIEERVYGPVIRAVTAFAGWVRRAHSGSVHLYLAYGCLGVLVVLVVAQ